MFSVWRDNFLWLSLNYFSGASVAALLLPFLQSSESAFIKVIGVILPLLLISYLTFKTALGRVEDANLHLAELNRLYLSTIETLAMAIDAKDQITHGHIRRVQLYAVKLATAMGVNDTKQIQAIEAAALLHDMGKLAVPEYILNKPGPLTPAEFERMKLHASVGADILSAIEFPYPVVPIVRHHHENWDGSGYPSGIAGADIPIGARILSVVDCFDALTSDRPYRPRLSDKDALKILHDRRGNMYDPLVVDAFTRLYPELAQEAPPLEESTPLANLVQSGAAQKERPQASAASLERIAETQSETLGLLQLGQELAKLKTADDMAEVVIRRIRHVVPASLGAVFLVDENRQDLFVVRSVGENEHLAAGLRIDLGTRLSGWVAANQQAIRNSDPVLDLGSAARSATPRLRSCMALPALWKSNCIGVVSLYSTQANAFTEEQERIATAILSHSSAALAGALQPMVVEPSKVTKSSHARTDALLYIRLADDELNSGRDSLMESLKVVIAPELRPHDVILTPGPEEILVVLRGLTANTGEGTGHRIRDRVSAHLTDVLNVPSETVFIAPLMTAAAELEDETIVRLARLRHSQNNGGEVTAGDGSRIH